jgi:hypothetical protein
LAVGQVSLTTPEGAVLLHPFQAFGHQAFVSGLQHRSLAMAVNGTEALRLSRSRLRSVLGGCPTFSGRLRDRVGSDDLAEYLRANHLEIGAHDIAVWTKTVDDEGMERLPLLLELAETAPTEQIVDHLRDVGAFRGLPGARVVA